MKHKHTKALSVLLTVLMIVGLLPWTMLSARADATPDGTTAEQAIGLGSWDELKAALALDATNKRTDVAEDAGHPTYYKLTANCTDGTKSDSSYIEVGSGRYVVLDLNGKTVDRGLTSSYFGVSNGHVIKVTGNLTLNDSGTGGTITGGNNNNKYSDGGGVYVGGTFTMNGGTISGNRTHGEQHNTQYGAGVFVPSGGTFTMNGGTISGNRADFCGGGVAVFGTFNMTGGTITGNHAYYAGGGVYHGNGAFNLSGGTITGNATHKNDRGDSGGGVYSCSYGTMSVSGKPAIKDNISGVDYSNFSNHTYSNAAQNNVFLTSYSENVNNEGTVLCVTGALLDGAEIYVTKYVYPGSGTEAERAVVGKRIAKKNGTYTLTPSDAAKFHSDADSTLVVQQSGDYVEFRKPATGAALSATSATYDGTNKLPSISVGDVLSGTTTLTKGSDYTVAWTNSAGDTATDLTNAGTYTMTAGGADSLYQNIEKTFTINKAPLTITANNHAITYGDTPANDGVEYSGFVGGETEADLNGSLAYDYSYAQYGNVGTYTITPKGLTSGNYEITFKPGTLTVNKADVSPAPTVVITDWTWGETASQPHVTGNLSGGAVTYEYKERSADDSTYSTRVPSAVGNYTVRATIGATQNYNATSATADFSIVKAVNTIVVQPSVAVHPNGTLDLSELVSGAQGTVTYSITNALTGCTVDASTGAFTAGDTMGTCTVTANAAGNDNYEAMGSSIYVVVTNDEIQNLAFQSSSVTKTFGDADFAVTVTGAADGATVTYSSANSSVATVGTDGTVHIVGVGMTIIEATSNKAGCATAKASYRLMVNKANVTGEPTFTAITEAGHTLADAAIDKSALLTAGDIIWNDGNATEVVQGKAYGWTFTPSNANYNIKTGTLIPWAKPVQPSYSGGSSSSGDDTPSTPSTTTTNADGSKTTTTKNADGSTTAVTTKQDGSTVTVNTAKDGSAVTTEKTADGSTATVKTDKSGSVVSTEVNPSAKAIEDAAKSGEPVTLPVEVRATGDAGSASEVKVTLPKGESRVTVEIPVSNLTPGTVAVIVKPDGTEEIVKTSTAGEDGVVLTLEESATVKIVDNTKYFSDVQPNDWFAPYIAWAASRGIMNGMGDGTFAPNATASRAQIAQMLFNLDGAKANGGLAAFSDVHAGDWFADAVTWLVENGIAQGTGESFGADSPISREQLAVMLYNYAQFKGYDVSVSGDVSGFPDADKVDGYARSALVWAVGAGLISGTTDENGNVVLDPQGGATRAQIAAIMTRFVRNAK